MTPEQFDALVEMIYSIVEDRNSTQSGKCERLTREARALLVEQPPKEIQVTEKYYHELGTTFKGKSAKESVLHASTCLCDTCRAAAFNREVE